MMMADLPDKLGKYRIERILGRGAMGTVYQGFDPDIERAVAIKVLHPHLLDSDQGPALRERFRREAKAAARCHHPNIVTVYDLGHDQGADFIVAELVAGEELKAFLESGTRFSLQEVGLIIGGILRALGAAHAQGIVHRDIKPANVLLLDDGNLKVADFGVARLHSSDLTLAGFMIGTPGYMSPEALRGDLVDARADLYSTGVILFELLTGERARLNPLNPDQHLPLIDEQVSGCSPPLNAALRAVLHKALAPETHRRFASANDFASALAQALGLTSLLDETLSTQLGETLISQRSLLPDKEVHKARTWSPELLGLLEKDLATWLGPMAPRLIKAAASTSTTAEGLIESLTRGIRNSDEKTLCIERLRKHLAQSAIAEAAVANAHGPATGSHQGSPASASIPEEELARIKTLLTRYLGPMAATLVQRSLRKTADRAELLRLLTAQIPSAEDQKAFLATLKER